MQIREYLNNFKEDFNLEDDAGIAYKIGTSKGNIDKWVQRNKIPDKWMLIMGQMSKDKHNVSDNANLYFLKKLNSKVSAGNGEESIDNESNIFPICKGLFRTKINEDNYKVVEVLGDSMEPTIKCGDHAVIKNGYSFQGDGLYVIRKGNELYIKRVIKNIDGSYIIKSDNPSYPDMQVSKESDEQHYIVGKVKAILPQIEE